jgi:hypothetical protein
MVKHVILWKLKQNITDAVAVKKGIKEGLESLYGVIPGIVEIKVQIESLPSSNADLMLDSTFENEAALKAYATHPAHVEVAHKNVIPYAEIRLCLDFEIA